jgi:hypothetical protein
MKKPIRKKGIIIGIIFLFLCANIATGIKKNTQDTQSQLFVSIKDTNETHDTVPITVSIYKKTGITQQTIDVTVEDATKMLELFTTLRNSMADELSSNITKHLQHDFLNLLRENDAIPEGVTSEELLSLMQPPALPFKHLPTGVLPFQNKASEWFCNFATFGEGAAFPIIILPRFIPIILTPIPRVFIYWSTDKGITSVGGLLSGTGFLAGGQQKGIALGFWGIGFSIFLPPVRSYGIFGYALYTRVAAEQFEFYPPNNPPRVTQTDPADGQQFVPLSTKELRFAIEDKDKDPISYSVTTEPDIGSDSGGLKPDGTYSVAVSGLESLTTYSWTIELTDGMDITKKTLTFTTEPVAPVIKDPIPADGLRDVPLDLSALQFTLQDYQGDAMSYTVTTSPYIGSDEGANVYNGTITIPVSGLTSATRYRWFVNVTDGTYWTRKIFNFETAYPEQFDPFLYGWSYRKSIVINHTNVKKTLVNFPVLISVTDNDLSSKAQENGHDILFMNNSGVSKKLHFEIERYCNATGTLSAWVNMTELSSVSDTMMYMYYGNPDCLTKENVEKTWDDHYLVVHHMQNDSAISLKDSTKYKNDIVSQTGTPSFQQPGKIEYCVAFSGSSSLNFATPIRNIAPITIEVWAKPDKVSGANYIFCNGGETGNSYGFYWYINSHQFGTTMMNLGQQLYVGQNGFSTAEAGLWTYCASTWDGSSSPGFFIINNQIIEHQSQTVIREKDPRNARIGLSTSGQYGFYGGIDEIRISDVARDVEWLSTCYTNQHNPSDFLSFGPEEGP